MTAHLLQPLTLRGTTLRNRIAVSPMCTYSAEDGLANDFHIAHYGQYGLGGFGLVMVEATGVEARGRITPGDMGIWSDAHVAPLARIAALLTQFGAVPGIQIAHAGWKASTQRPWQGGGAMGASDAARGELPWAIVAPSAMAYEEGMITPAALALDELEGIRDAFVEGARRAVRAGFAVVELHMAHGYLMHSFLSPIANRRTDAYGGPVENRMRLPLEVAAAVRAALPESMPLFARISSVDGVEGGRELAESVLFAQKLKAAGVDVIDASSGGMPGKPNLERHPGYMIPFAEAIRQGAGIATMAVGLITRPEQAEAALAEGRADIIALGRQALENPYWPRMAEKALGQARPDFSNWPDQYAWGLRNRHKLFEDLGIQGE